MTSASVATQIADLLAWARRLSDTHHPSDAAERAAYQAAKTDLLARITAKNCHRTEDQP
jgi:hypothetical protein